MKNRFHRIAFLLTALLLSAAGTSCGDSAIAPTETSDASGTTTAAATTEVIPSEYTSPEVDYAGETFTMAAYYEVSPSWKAQNYCEAFSEGENGDPLNDAIFQRNRNVSEDLNVNIELYPLDTMAGAADQVRKQILTGEDIIDIAMIRASGLPTLLGTNALVDLYTLQNVDFSHSWWDQNAVSELTLMDKMYAVTGDISLYNNYAPITYFFNKQIVNELDLDDPYTLVKDGKWTLDKVRELCTAAVYDLNGDGKMYETDDRYGMMSEDKSLMYAAYAGGVTLTDKDADEIPVLNVNVDRASTVTDMFAPFMNDANVNLFSLKLKGKYNNQFFELFLPMFTENRALFFNNQLMVAMNLRDMDADFGILPPPKMDETQKDYMVPISIAWSTFLVMPITNDKYDMTGHVIEAMGYFGQQMVTPAFIETTVQGKTLRDDESVEMLDILLSNRVYDIATFYNWGGINDMFSQIAINPRQQFASSYAKIEKKVQAALEKTVDLLKTES